jgi:hypothetical protein
MLNVFYLTMKHTVYYGNPLEKFVQINCKDFQDECIVSSLLFNKKTHTIKIYTNLNLSHFTAEWTEV